MIGISSLQYPRGTYFHNIWAIWMISDGISTSNLKNIMLKVSLSMINLGAIKWNAFFSSKNFVHFQSQNFLGSSKKVAQRKVSSFYILAYDVLKIQIHESLGGYLMTKKILNLSQVLLLIPKIWNMLEDWLRFLLMCITSKIIV